MPMDLRIILFSFSGHNVATRVLSSILQIPAAARGCTRRCEIILRTHIKLWIVNGGAGRISISDRSMPSYAETR